MRFGVLGPLAVSGENGPPPLGGPRQRTLLAHLVLSANHVVPADWLVDAVWAEDLPEDPRATLQVYISRLRSAVGATSIEGRAPGYVLHAEPDEVDALRFEAMLGEVRRTTADPRTIVLTLEDALALWRGPALADLAGEPSLSGEIARLEELRLQAIEEKIGAELELGRHASVVAELEVLTRAHRLRERLCGELMLALYRSGRQGEALAAFDRARTILAEELGIDPSNELRALHQRILRQDPDLELEGEPLRGYRLLEQIGEGAFGVVYRATQPQIGREVAIKAVPPELANHPDFVRRFEREAQIVARLEHPHIVPLYDYWRQPDGAYLVMRFLRGGSLEQLLARGPLDAERAVQILDQVAAALTAAHRQGVVHRDVKPANVLLDEEGNAYLTDFGVALDAGSREKSSGTLMRGTPAHLSPEQIRLDPATPRSDVYALGIVLYEMLTAAHPFDEESIEALLDRHLRDPLPSVSATRPDLPGDVEQVIARATAKDTEVRFSGAFELAAAFRAAVEGAASVAEPAGEIRNPYKGLRAFLEADAADFFGREAVTERLLRRLEGDQAGARFLAVVGPSGSGKSSVVRAGLVPALRRGALPGSERWYVIDLLPGPHPLRELESALLGVAVEPPPSLLDELETDTRGLLRAADRVLPDPDAELVIVLDQLEEVFTLVESEDERRHVLESIRVAADESGSRVRCVATLRADFFDQPLSVRGFGELLAEHTEPITPMAPEELERAIVAPADRAGLSVEPRLVAAMVADVVDRPGALPLLQFTLTELAERREDGVLALAGYRRIGGVSGALARRAEQLFEALEEGAKEACRQLFLRLVTLGEGTEDTRRRVRRSELTPLADPLAMKGVIQTFGRYRLLSFDRYPETREPTVEIAHEALLSGWSRLQEWVDEARDDIRAQRRLSAAAAEWVTNERDPSFLLRGARLDSAAVWTETTTLQVSSDDRDYLDESIRVREAERDEEDARLARERALERRSIRRMRGLIAVLTAAALVAATLTFLSLDQRRRAESASRIARDAETAQLAQRLGAQALVEEDLDLSLLLARQAVAIDDSPQTRGYLLAALRRSPQAIGIMHGTGVLTAAAISPDGGTLAVGHDRLWLFDTETYRQIGDSPWDLGVESLAFSPDGKTLAVGTYGHYVRLIDARTGEHLARTTVGGAAFRLAFTKDGSRLVVLEEREFGDAGALITIRDAATLRQIGPSIEPEALGGEAMGLEWQSPQFALMPDDRSLVTASEDGELAMWALRNGEKLHTFRIEPGLHSLALSPDGRTAAVGVEGGIQFVDLPSGDVQAATGSTNGRPTWLLFTPKGDTVASTNADGTVTLWDVGSARPRETLRGFGNSFQQSVFSPDGETLYTVSHDSAAVAWDLTGERGLGRPFTFTADRTPWTWEVHPARFSPDGRLFAVGLKGRGIALWDARKLTRVGARLLETGGEVKSLAFSPDGRTLAAAAFGDVITLWDVGSRSRLLREPIKDSKRFRNLDMPWVGIDFSPDGRTLAMTTGSGLRLLDVTARADSGATGAERVLPAISADGFDPAFSADGTMIATSRGAEGGARVWDVATGAAIATVDALPGGPEEGSAVALSPDGRTLAEGGFAPVVRLVDVRTERLLHELDVGPAGALSLEFSPDGRTLAVSGWESEASLWDVATGTQIGPNLTAASRRTKLDLSPDGRRLLMAAANGQGAVWDIDPESWKQRACEIANRTLSREEWEEFLPGRPYEPACR